MIDKGPHVKPIDAQRHSLLFVVDMETWNDSPREVRLLSKLCSWLMDREGQDVLILPFVNVNGKKLLTRLQAHFTGRTTVVEPIALMDAVAPVFREQISKFGADLRSSLESLARVAGGDSWGTKFAYAWWWMEISCRNLPGNPVWASLMRLQCIKSLLQNDSCAALAYLGDGSVSKIVNALCSLRSTECRVACVGRRVVSLPSLLLRRAYGCAALLAAHLLARCTPKSSGKISGPSVLAVSYYPRSWMESKQWGDRYYGDLMDRKSRNGTTVVLALGIVDTLRRGHLAEAFFRQKMLSARPPDRPFTLLERWTSVSEILAAHADPRPLLSYGRMRRDSTFKKALEWQGMDLTPLLDPMLQKSIVIDWPRAQILEACMCRAAKQLQPDEAILPFFEFPVGRALVRGLRKGGILRIIGLQHGPITPMKLAYMLHPNELSPTLAGGPPLPEPDRYLVETPLAKEILSAGGVDKSRIQIQAAVRLKSATRVAPDSRRKVSANGKPIHALVGLGLHDVSAILAVIHEAVTGSSVAWVIKPHPKTLPSELAVWKELLQESSVSWADARADIHGLMHENDVFIGTYSSVILEAIWLGLPVVMLRNPRTPDLSPFSGSQIRPYSAADGQTLRSHVIRLANDASLQELYIQELQGTLPWAVGPVAAESLASSKTAKAAGDASVRN